MQKRKFTVVTQLHDKNNSQIIEYVENSRATYELAEETAPVETIDEPEQND